MSEPEGFSLSAVNRKRGQTGGDPKVSSPHASSTPEVEERAVARATAVPEASPGGFLEAMPFDPVRLVSAVLRGWWILLATGFVLALVAALLGWFRFATSYTATVQLIRRELPNSFRASDTGEAFKPRQFSAATVTAMMRSPSLLAKVGAQAKPRVTGSLLGSSLVITPEKNTDLITVSLRAGESATATADLLNLYANQVVELTKGLQAQESLELDAFLREQLAKTETELAAANQELLDFSREASFFSSEKEAEAYLRALNEAELRLQSAHLEYGTLNFRIAAAERELGKQDPQKLRLTEARTRLNEFRAQYTDRNPLVVEQLGIVESLEKQIDSGTNSSADYQAGPNTVANSLYLDLVSFRAQRDAMEKQFPQLEEYRNDMFGKLQGLPEKSLRYAKLKARQASLEVTRDLLSGRQREAQLFAQNSPGYYRVFAPATPGQVSKSSRSKKLVMVTLAGFLVGAATAMLLLLVVETLDDRLLSPADLRRLIGSRLVVRIGEFPAMNESQLATWRFRTWSLLQRELASSSAGNIVFGVVSAKAGEGRSEWIHQLQRAAAEREWGTLTIVNRPTPGITVLAIDEATAQPLRVTQILAKSGHVNLTWDENWPWNAAQRAELHAMIRSTQSCCRLAVMVELPPATRLESIMLAETLPHVFWLSQSGATRKAEAAELVDTLRLAQVKLSGAFLNRFGGRLAKLYDLGRIGLWLLLCSTPALAVQAQEPASGLPPSLNTNQVFSALATGPQLASWQQRLTLGAGDVLNLSIYGKKQFTRAEVPVGPDGRISYLQAHGVMATGLTIEELRDKLNQELSEYYKNVQVIVTPAAWRSKKYYLLGTIMDRGAYYLDQPMTIIEATSRARGIATGLLEQNTVEIADLPRTFLIRQGKRVPVDFVKLFAQGDLTQNIQLEPGDYIYFPSATVNEVYVLGAVSSPGTVGVTEKASVVSVITTRGGFKPKAYRQRVLVIRGSLNQPETHIVNVGAVLSAKANDFLLQPKDIIYVSERPWSRVEELLDMAVRAFIITATAEWVNMNVAPVITEPILPSP